MVRFSGGGQVFGLLPLSFCRGGTRLKAEAVVAGFDDLAVLNEPIEQRCGHFRISDHAGPCAEAEVCRDRHAGALIEPAERVEEQGSAGRAELQIAKLIQDHEIDSNQSFGDLTGLSQGFLLLERISAPSQ